MSRSYTSELTLLAIIVVCVLATWKVSDPSTLLSNAVAGLLGYIAKEPFNAAAQSTIKLISDRLINDADKSDPQ